MVINAFQIIIMFIWQIINIPIPFDNYNVRIWNILAFVLVVVVIIEQTIRKE